MYIRRILVINLCYIDKIYQHLHQKNLIEIFQSDHYKFLNKYI